MNERDYTPSPRLPDDPAYWDGLSERIEAGAIPLLEPSGAVIPFGRRWVPALAASAVLASLAAWPWLPPSAPRWSDDGEVVTGALSASDPLAVLFSGGQPPTVESLLGAEALLGGGAVTTVPEEN